MTEDQVAQFAKSPSAPTDLGIPKVVSTTIITPEGDIRGTRISALWDHRDLIHSLAMRSIRTRYRRTKLGLVWAIVQPLVYMIVINLFFGMVLRFDTGEVPYPLHLLTGLIAFQFFTKGLGEGANSIFGNQGILTKVYIPPIIFPTASIYAGLIDFVFPILLLIGFLIYYQVMPTQNLFALPLVMLFLFILYASAQLFLSATAVRFKDVKMTIPVITQLMFFGTPIFYPLSSVPDHLVPFFALNPMVGIIESLRWSVLGRSTPPDASVLMVSGFVIFLSCILALYTFRSLGGNLYRYF